MIRRLTYFPYIRHFYFFLKTYLTKSHRTSLVLTLIVLFVIFSHRFIVNSPSKKCDTKIKSIANRINSIEIVLLYSWTIDKGWRKDDLFRSIKCNVVHHLGAVTFTYLWQGWRRYARETVLGTYVSCALLRIRAFASTIAEHATAHRAEFPFRWEANGRLRGSDPGFPRAAFDRSEPGASVTNIRNATYPSLVVL